MTTLKERFNRWIAGIILGGWIISIIADIIITDYSTPWEIHAICGAVVGGLFGINPFKGFTNDKR